MTTGTTRAAPAPKKRKPKAQAVEEKMEQVLAAPPPKRMISLDVIKINNYKDFGELDANRRGEVLSALNYIEMLGSTTGTDLSKVDIFEVFGDGEMKIVTAMKDVNHRFFSFLERLKTTGPAMTDLGLSDEIKVRINEVSKGIGNTRITQLKKQADDYQRAARDHYRTAENYITQAYQAQTEVDAYKPEDSSIAKEIEEALKEKFWTFHSLNGSKLRLVTTASVTSPHTMPGGEKVIATFGKIMTEIDLNKMSLICLPHEDNTLYQFIHPHVRDGGWICWGTASDTATRNLAQGKLASVLRLLAAVLTNYNDSGGYNSVVTGMINGKGKKLTVKQIKKAQAEGFGNYGEP